MKKIYESDSEMCDVYIDWFYLCHMPVDEFLHELALLALNCHVHLTGHMPSYLSGSITGIPCDILDPTCAEALTYVNDELLNDADFLHDVQMSNSLDMLPDVGRLQFIKAKHPNCTVTILCPLADIVLSILSVTYLSLGNTPKVNVYKSSVRDYLFKKSEENKVVFYTENGAHTFEH